MFFKTVRREKIVLKSRLVSSQYAGSVRAARAHRKVSSFFRSLKNVDQVHEKNVCESGRGRTAELRSISLEPQPCTLLGAPLLNAGRADSQASP